MSDKITAIIAVPIDNAVPLDVQGVGLRRKAIELMQEIAEIDESTVRYQQASDSATMMLEDGGHLLSLWQLSLIGVMFRADGKAKKGVCGAVFHKDEVARVFSSVSVVRNEFD